MNLLLHHVALQQASIVAGVVERSLPVQVSSDASTPGWHAWVTLAVILGVLFLLVTERVPPAVAVLGGVVVLFVVGVIDVSEAFGGFSNPAPITVAALYVAAGAARATGALDLLPRMLRRGGSLRGDLARITIPTAGSSAFLNNTPIVAVFAPQIVDWCRRWGRPVSPYLLPLSFAAILGGLLTVIGTSTNIVVSELLADQPGEEPLGLFEIAAVGLPVAVVGLVLLVVVGPLLLPRRKGAVASATADAREYTVEMVVRADGPLVGRTVEDAGLRHLQGVFLVEIERSGHAIAPVPPTEVLQAEDRLVFAGNVEQVVDLQRIRGMRSVEQPHFEVGTSAAGQRFFEAVVGVGVLAGQTLKQADFRGRYGASVVAIHRSDERLRTKLGEAVLRRGDVLLVLADEDWDARWRGSRDFLLVSGIGGSAPIRTAQAPFVVLGLLFLLATAATGLLSILQASLVVAFAFVASRILSLREARAAVDVDVVITIAASFGLGAALTQSGLADDIASVVIDVFDGLGDRGVLLGILLASILLTEIVTNNAAAVLMFAIVVAVADSTGIDVRPLAVAVALGASASFLTPLGYQTNTMVYGMGGYRYTDFARVGLPLTLTVLALGVLVIPLAWPLT